MIKNLIIPIDISILSERSIEYSLNLEKVSNGLKITLVGCGFEEEVINKKTLEYLEKIKAQISNTTTIEVVLANGKFHEEIGVIANSVEDPLILISAFKASKNKDHFSSQDVIKIVDAAKQHILYLPEEEFDSQIKKIIYPIHMQSRVRHKATFTARLAKAFNAEVDIVSTQINLKEKKKKMCSLYCQQVSNHYKSIGIPISIHSVEGSNLATTVSTYSVENNADIISIIPEDKNDIRLFATSYLQDLLSKVTIPTLIIAGRKVKYSGSFSAAGG